MVVAKQKVITVATSGTRVQLFTSAVQNPGPVISVVFKCHTGTIYIGDANVSSTAYGFKLAATDAPVVINLSEQPLDMQSLYIDGAANSDKLAVLYFEKVSR